MSVMCYATCCAMDLSIFYFSIISGCSHASLYLQFTQLGGRRAFMQFNTVPLRTRRVLLLCKV